MKKNLKVGDKVTINLSAKYDGPCNITNRMRKHDKCEAEIVSITDSYDGTNRYKLDVDGRYSFYVDEWLEPIKKRKKKKGQVSLVIPINDWEKIYDIACGEWKKKLYAMVEPFADTVTINEEFADSMIKASTTSQIDTVRRVLSIAGYAPSRYQDYFDFGDEYKVDGNVSDKPIYIRMGLATNGMESKEIGLNDDSFEIIVVEGGVERTLNSDAFLKFKKK